MAINATENKAAFQSTADIQKIVCQNEVSYGSASTDVTNAFCLLYGKVAEAYDAWEKGKKLEIALADAALHLLEIAEMNKIDLGNAINERIDTEAPCAAQDKDDFLAGLNTEMRDYFMDGVK